MQDKNFYQIETMTEEGTEIDMPPNKQYLQEPSASTRPKHTCQ